MTDGVASRQPLASLASNLAGFDAEFLSLEHYIRVITDRI